MYAIINCGYSLFDSSCLNNVSAVSLFYRFTGLWNKTRMFTVLVLMSLEVRRSDMKFHRTPEKVTTLLSMVLTKFRS